MSGLTSLDSPSEYYSFRLLSSSIEYKTQKRCIKIKHLRVRTDFALNYVGDFFITSVYKKGHSDLIINKYNTNKRCEHGR